jgi:hypothetical protein
MAISTFGVTYTEVGRELIGYEGRVDDYQTLIEDWINRDASYISVQLLQRGFAAADIEALGTGDTLYQLCRDYIITACAARLARASTHQNPDVSQMWDEKVKRIEGLLLTHTESLSEDWDRDTDLGSFRTHSQIDHISKYKVGERNDRLGLFDRDTKM